MLWRKILLVVFTLIFAFGVLFVSVFRTASTKYQFNSVNSSQPQNITDNENPEIVYVLPYPGNVLPDSPLWPLKAFRDKLWLMVNTQPQREAELKLLFADKRLGMAKLLFEKGKPEIGLTTLTKAEKYLEEASRQVIANKEKGYESADFLKRLADASLKHYQVVEYIQTIAPENAKPTIIGTEKYSRKTFEDTRNMLLGIGITPSNNPFNW